MFPRLGDRMALIPYDDIRPVVTAIVMVQRDFRNCPDGARGESVGAFCRRRGVEELLRLDAVNQSRSDR